MRKTFGFLFLVVTAVPFAFGQTPSQPDIATCNYSLATAPSVRGIRLGMRLEELFGLFPGLSEEKTVKEKIDQSKLLLPTNYPGGDGYGLLRFDIKKETYSSLPRFEGVSGFYFTFFDDRLVEFTINYSGTPWDRVEDMVSRVADVLKLPSVSNWSGSNTSTNLSCSGFYVWINVQPGQTNSSLRMAIDQPEWNRINRLRQSRRAAEMQKAKDAFKP